MWKRLQRGWMRWWRFCRTLWQHGTASDLSAPSLPPRATGAQELDAALRGGLPAQGLVMISGPEARLNNLLETILCAACARRERVVWLDLLPESFDMRLRLQHLDIWLAQAHNAANAAKIIELLLPASDLITIDSSAGWFDGDTGVTRHGLQQQVAHLVHRARTVRNTLVVLVPDEAPRGAHIWRAFARVEIRCDTRGHFRVADRRKREKVAA